MAKILILDECPSTRNLLAEELAGEGNIVLSTGMPDLILEEITAFNPEVAILDLFVKGKYRWDLLEGIKNRGEENSGSGEGCFSAGFPWKAVIP